MSDAKRRIIQRRRRRIQRNRRAAAVCAMVMMAVMLSILSHNFSARAERPEAVKYYADVRVGRGDTLWSIAEAYITDEYDSMAEYIHEIKEINHLGLDLPYGKILVVPYYSGSEMHE